ncbi:MarR family transcriptional regulator [uncultured Roseibium sp.]|uniref:MarR family winged helix-turn-helix transcriptional regulator n=1 Tax=uncultured Roseibium sp. TaxID=1936171 RepID=UPI0026108F88|nr:MarR family transcriptional regulator [uncultured Roseibium sp.]
MSEQSKQPQHDPGPDGAEHRVLKLRHFMPYRLNHLAETVSRSFSKIYADKYGIGIPEWRVLATLGEHGSMAARDIGRETSMHKTKVSRAVSSLAEKGFLERNRSLDDQREQSLHLSKDGLALYEDIVPKALSYSEDLLDALTEDQQAMLKDILDRLARAADPTSMD